MAQNCLLNIVRTRDNHKHHAARAAVPTFTKVKKQNLSLALQKDLSTALYVE